MKAKVSIKLASKDDIELNAVRGATNEVLAVLLEELAHNLRNTTDLKFVNSNAKRDKNGNLVGYEITLPPYILDFDGKGRLTHCGEDK